MSSSSSTTMPIGLQIAHGGYDARGESFDEPSHKEKARFFFFPPTYFSLFLCVLYFLLQFFVFVPDHKNTSRFVVFFSLIFPILHPQNPFFANVRWFSPRKPLIHTHTHVRTNQNRIAIITTRSDPPLQITAQQTLPATPTHPSTIPWRLPPPPDMNLSSHCNYLLFCNWWLCRLKSLGFLSERWRFTCIYKSQVSSGFTRVDRVFPGQFPSGFLPQPGPVPGPGRPGPGSTRRAGPGFKTLTKTQEINWKRMTL